MPKSQITPISLLAAVAAAGIMLLYAGANHGFGYETTIAGLTLLLVVFAYDAEGYRPAFQSLAFAAATGFCAMLAAGFPIALIMHPKSPEEWSASIWVAATLLFFAVDRLRSTSQESTAMALSSSPSSAAPYPTATPTIRPTPVPAPVAPPATFVSSQPVFVAAEPPAATSFYSPDPLPPPPAPPSVAPAPPPTTLPPEAASVEVAAIPPGREALIFLNLLGEGLNVLRSVKAEHLGRDYYRIADIMPENERWEYVPNQVVRARKKALSNGKHLVAFEEAPRA